MAVFKIDVDGLTQADRALRRFGGDRLGLAAHFGLSWARRWRPSHNGAGRYADVADGSENRWSGRTADSAGRCFRGVTRRAHIRIVHFLRQIRATRDETAASNTLNSRQPRRARRAFTGPGSLHAPSGPVWRSKHDTTRDRDQALHRHRGHVAAQDATHDAMGRHAPLENLVSGLRRAV